MGVVRGIFMGVSKGVVMGSFRDYGSVGVNYMLIVCEGIGSKRM